MISQYKNILFDLDGTLTDPFLGITRCISYALDKLNAPTPHDLKWCIGPPLHESFQLLLKDHSAARDDDAVTLYRERFSTIGMFENQVYDGIIEMLDTLHASSARLYVATSKPHVYASKIIEHFKLDAYFQKIYGAELDGMRTDKSELIKFILESESMPPAETIMIGDRMHDLRGARHNGVAAIGITWGYGDLDELRNEAPQAIINSPYELMHYLMP